MNETVLILILLVLGLQVATFLKARGGRRIARGSILLDTSAIMDGRIVDVATTGVLTAELIVPRSVIREMQLLADKSDNDKRARARAGLENIKKLQKMDTVTVSVVDDGYAKQGVDERLLDLAEKYSAAIATVDYNLNKVAQTMDITVINVNELARVLRMNYLPGERLDLILTQTGQNKDQAVGYLEDGTMVVVADSKSLIGQKIKVEIVRALQTEAGRMMFAKKVGGDGHKQAENHNKTVTETQQPSEQVKSNNNRKPVHNNYPRKTYRSKRKPRTPEDSLIDTANNR